MDSRRKQLLVQAALMVALASLIALIPGLGGAQVLQKEKAGGPGMMMQKMSSMPTATDNTPTIPWPRKFKRRKASAEEIAQWIKELGDNSFKVREAANKALVEVGQPAVQGLEQVKHGADAEVRRRAESLIENIELNEALAPTTIDLK